MCNRFKRLKFKGVACVVVHPFLSSYTKLVKKSELSSYDIPFLVHSSSNLQVSDVVHMNIHETPRKSSQTLIECSIFVKDWNFRLDYAFKSLCCD